MKKTLTLLTLVLISFGAFAQRDVDLRLDSLISADEYTSSADDMTFLEFELVITNFGPDPMLAGDSIGLSYVPFSVTFNGNEATLTPISSDQILGLEILTSDIPVNSTVRIPTDLTLNGTILQSFDAAMLVEIIALNRPALLLDPEEDSRETNIALTFFSWLHQNGSSVSISDVQYNGNIRAYPNPASSTLNVDLLLSNIEESTVELYDLSGKLVYSAPLASSFNEGTHSLDVSSFENGLYVLKVNNGLTTSTTKISVSH